MAEKNRRSDSLTTRIDRDGGEVTPDTTRQDDMRGPSDEPQAPRLERIARRAYEIYDARGGANGRSVDDWLQAEQEIDSE